MTNLNQALINLYRSRDMASSASRGSSSAPPQTPAAEILSLAQASCVVGTWNDAGGAADGSSPPCSERGPQSEPETSSPATLKFDSHLPAVLAAAATAAGQNSAELDGGPEGVEFSRPFAQLPRTASAVREERPATRGDRVESASQPRAKVIATMDTAHAVPRPHFDAAAVAAPTTVAAESAIAKPITAEPQVTNAGDSTASATVEHPASSKKKQKTAARDFRPAWEVDNFDWPLTVSRLFDEQADRFDSLVAKIVQLADSGAKRIAVVGSGPGAGGTTLSLCLARRLSEVVEKVALVDGNLDNPQLAAELDVQLDAGWEDVLAGRQVADEAAVASVGDGITLLPVMTAGAALLADTVAERTASVLQDLARNHDVVLIDAGPVGQGAGSVIAGSERPVVDAAVVVCDSRRPAEKGLRETVAELADRGISTVAVAENFQAVAAAGYRKAA